MKRNLTTKLNFEKKFLAKLVFYRYLYIILYIFLMKCTCLHENKNIYIYYISCVMVFNTTFNNISVKSWWSVLLVAKTEENHWPVANHWQTLSHNVVSGTPDLSRIWTGLLLYLRKSNILSVMINLKKKTQKIMEFFTSIFA